jgi:hypothetical protein
VVFTWPGGLRLYADPSSQTHANQNTQTRSHHTIENPRVLSKHSELPTPRKKKKLDCPTEHGFSPTQRCHLVKHPRTARPPKKAPRHDIIYHETANLAKPAHIPWSRPSEIHVHDGFFRPLFVAVVRISVRHPQTGRLLTWFLVLIGVGTLARQAPPVAHMLCGLCRAWRIMSIFVSRVYEGFVAVARLWWPCVVFCYAWAEDCRKGRGRQAGCAILSVIQTLMLESVTSQHG